MSSNDSGCLGLLVMIIVVVCIVCVGFKGCDYIDCKATGYGMKRDVDYSIFSGCMVHTESGLVPLKNWRSED